jgi:hypothetical protein
MGAGAAEPRARWAGEAERPGDSRAVLLEWCPRSLAEVAGVTRAQRQETAARVRLAADCSCRSAAPEVGCWGAGW